MEGLDRMEGVSNYYIGSERSRWRSGVPHYRRVRARDVYEGIDVVYYSSGGELEYDFVVAPGADPSRIRLAFDHDVRLDSSGVLVIGGVFRQHRPKVYQRDGDHYIEIAAGYRIESDSTVAFQLDSYDPALPLTIDPVIAYSQRVTASDTVSIVVNHVAFVAWAWIRPGPRS
jgi:hypothetical protein